MRSIRRERRGVWAIVGGPKTASVGDEGSRRFTVSRHYVSMPSGGVSRQVEKGHFLPRRCVEKWIEIHVRRAHLVSVVVQTHLPADEVLDVLDHNVSCVRVCTRVRRRARKTTVDATDRHRVGRGIVTVARRVHVQAQPRVLSCACPQRADKKRNDCSERNAGCKACGKKIPSTSHCRPPIVQLLGSTGLWSCNGACQWAREPAVNETPG